MNSVPKKLNAAIVGGLTAAALLVPTTVASAAPNTAETSGVELNGYWAPFTRCPVDDPAMLSADGRDKIPQCVTSSAPSGTITLGNMTMPIGATNLQFGLIKDTSENSFSIIAPPGGAIQAEPVDVPGGLLGLMCPSDIPIVTDLCERVENSELNSVTATVVPAGEPSSFSLAAGTMVGEPILRLPVKIHLENPLLGEGCFIGSNSNPIVLRPRNLTSPTGTFQRFEGDGTPAYSGVMFRLVIDATQGDRSFAVPGAHGCGPFDLADFAINAKLGLPSPSGNNSLVLNDATTYIAGLNYPAGAAPNAGQVLSDYWHSAVLP